MLYYFDTYWRTWVRRLLVLPRTGQRLDMDMTGGLASEERIRVHMTSDAKIEIVTELPPGLYDNVILDSCGKIVADRLLNFDYIKAIGLKAILDADKEWTQGGGIPVANIIASKGFTVQSCPCGHVWTSHNTTLAKRQLGHTALDALIVPSSECPLCGDDDDQRHYEYLQDLGEGMFDREAT